MRHIAKLPVLRKVKVHSGFYYFFFNLEHKCSLEKVAVPIKKFIHTRIYVKYNIGIRHKLWCLPQNVTKFLHLCYEWNIFSVLIFLYFLYLMTICSEHLASPLPYVLPISNVTNMSSCLCQARPGCLSGKQPQTLAVIPLGFVNSFRGRACVMRQCPVLSLAPHR